MSGSSSRFVIMLVSLPAIPFSVISPLDKLNVPIPQMYPTCLSDQLLVYNRPRLLSSWSVFIKNRLSIEGETALEPFSVRKLTIELEK